jgi:AraC-like DNA-binding protein
MPDLADTMATPLLPCHQRVTSTDISVLHDAVEPLAIGHDLHAREPGRPLDGIVNGLTLGSVSLVWVRYGGAGVIVDTPPIGGEFALAVPCAPMGVEYRGRRRRETAAASLVVSPDEAMRMTPDPVAGCLVVATTISRLTGHLHDYLGRTPPRPLSFHGVTGPAVMAGPVLDQAWRHACAMLGAVPPGGLHPMAARSIEQSLLSAILVGLPHTATPELAGSQPLPGGNAGRIRDWLEAHHDRPVGVADIAAATGLSIRRVQVICRQAWDQTPMQVLRGIRLDHARAALQTADPFAVPVHGIAAAAGFTRMTRFNAAYQQRFGETPAQTRRGGAAH